MATRTMDNKMHEVMMSGRCRCGEPSPCLRVILARSLDALEAESGHRSLPLHRKAWLDATQAEVRQWHHRTNETRID